LGRNEKIEHKITIYNEPNQQENTMQTIIGLGQAGCNIADCFKQYPQYNILKIDTSLKKAKDSIGLKPQSSPELYEEAKLPRGINKFLEDIEPETLFITSCGAVSNTALRILEKIKDKTKITLMYVVPQMDNLAGPTKLQNNLLFNVFQEYARSALFEKIILVDNQLISGIMGPVPILKYWDSINQMISSTYHMINIFEHSRPVFTTFTKRIDTARVSTIGLVDFEEEEEKCFFSLDIPREKRYYYAIPQKMLEEDSSLMDKIQKHVKKGVEHDKMKVGYSVFSTEYDQPLIYCENNSTLIQKLAP